MVSEKKQQLVQRLAKEIREYPIIGLIDLENLPAAQFQKMRKTLLKSGVVMAVSRKRLISRALDESNNKNISPLKEKIRGMPALLFSKGNPFALYATLQKNKSEAAAKPGQRSPKEIVVKAGPTSFAPGPIISELAAVGIKTKVEQGKLSIISDVVVAKEGDVISQKLCETLKRLDIKPMEIGLNLVAVWENGLVFDAKELRVDETEYSDNFTQAARWAMNLAVECAYACVDTSEILLQKAFRDAKAVGVEAGVVTEETRADILAKAEREALSVKQEANL
ncbi:50S ribosomal protein L10 [Candidatus Woesearchaeota archaeon]|nr:50S ribosomal protein L10 [Candidatus Woesearchaeota archaeon]